MLEEEFIRKRVKELTDIANEADPFIRQRLLNLASSYERRLGKPQRPPVSLRGLQTKMSAER